MEKVGVGLVGCGTVGRGVVQVLMEQKAAIAGRHGVVLELKKIFTRNPQGDKSRAIYERYPKLFVSDINDITGDPGIDVVVETAGGLEFPLMVITKAIWAGKHIVTANKFLLAYKGQKIFQLARDHGVEIGFEASVAGAIPIIRVTRDSLPGRQIQSITGILNGTTNFILTKMAQGQGSYQEILALAQKEGFAEANPYEDISGIDARNKLAVLAHCAFGLSLEPDSIHTEGISEIIAEDFEYAQKKLNATIKLIAHCRDDGSAFVCPMIIPKDDFLASINNELNGVKVFGRNFGELGFSGSGAGSRPTASSIMADLVQITKPRPEARKVKSRENETDAAAPFGNVSFNHTLRFIVKDGVGIIRDVSSILAKERISIKAVEQNDYPDQSSYLPFLITLHAIQEKRVQRAVEKINELPFMVEPVHIFRSFSIG